MNYLWAAMMLLAVVYGALRGTVPAVTQAALDSAREAITLCLTMLGMLSFWMGMMQIGRASGLIRRMTRGIRPVLRKLFPRIPEDHPALEHVKERGEKAIKGDVVQLCVPPPHKSPGSAEQAEHQKYQALPSLCPRKIQDYAQED